ncbi:5-formyltetrahydrofolate cyclo-ligase, partial [Campylobacter coli]|nr:5-formyltetrahydrofolate cyclo-ligase [Campylobacter coli]EAI7288916.1 5-formyltetrahydrofolate cyclo-ligase [Campylobacter coli]EAI8501965.1 5-formyltetrahydrofolate cyclo-ligase [Campylobacter coli]EAJ9606547.1 5-formyltetrahydrofolate cyclo-ligase [Campylobacter coli]EAL3838947.1 5-formyltetrahydrofolate cyclo-ligase [Campylobacter coli]
MQKTSFRTLQKNRLAQHKKLKFKQDFIVFKECFNLIKKTKAKNILIFIPLGY